MNHPSAAVPMTVAERFAINLRRCRRRAGLSPERTALRASLHRTEIGLLEAAQRVPRIDTLVRLAAAVEASPAELLDGIEWLSGERRRGRFAVS